MNPNIAAFLRVIRAGESRQDDSAYTLLNGGGHFSGFADHPYAGQPAPPGLAAGAYQYIPHTWARVAATYEAKDFSPAEQDRVTGAWIEALAGPAIRAGDLATAMSQLKSIWISLASMPPSKAQAVFQQYGGALVGQEPAPQPAPEPAPSQGTSMPILALLPLIAQFIPQIMTLIKPESKSTAKDAQVAQTILNTVVQAAGVVTDGSAATASTVAQAAEKMGQDPALAQKVQEAVVTHPDVMELLEVGGGGVEAARQYALGDVGGPWWRFLVNAAFWIALALLPLLYMVVYRVLWGSFSEQLQTVVVTAIVSGLLGSITGFFFGSAYQHTRQAVQQQQSST